MVMENYWGSKFVVSMSGLAGKGNLKITLKYILKCVLS